MIRWGAGESRGPQTYGGRENESIDAKGGIYVSCKIQNVMLRVKKNRLHGPTDRQSLSY